jgi:ADP-ribose pyrophosphatase
MLYDGYRSVLGRRYVLPNGIERELEIKLEGPTAVVLALTPEDEVLLVREFRPGVEEVLGELPGGAVDEGEEPLEAARRELLEETGYAGEVEYAGGMVDCAYSTRIRHTFVARGCVKIQDLTPDEGESPELEIISLGEFREHLRSGRLTDVGPAYLGLDHAGLL